MVPAENSAKSFLFSRLLGGIFALLAVAYLIDLSWFQMRVSFPKLGQASGSVHRVRLLAIPDKGGKIGYEVDEVTPEEDVLCARSIFPHSSQNPCWYVAKHAKDPIPM